MADPRQLTDDEARVLRGLETLPDPAQYGAWVLRGKDVHGMALEALQLGDLLWADIDFANVHWQGGTLQRAQIQNSRFSDVTFSRCVFEDVLFIDCKLNNLGAAGVRFTRCRFERCEFAALHTNGTTFYDCTFEASRLLGAELRESVLQACELSACDLEFVRTGSSRIDACALRQGSLRHCRFSYTGTRGLTLDGVEVEQSLIVGGEHERWQFVALRGAGLKVVSVVLRDLQVSGCQGFADLRLITSIVHGAQFGDNRMLLGLMIFRSEVTALHIADSTLVQSNFDEAQIGPSSVYEAVVFDGLSIADSQLTRAQFMRCRFSDYFYLYRTELHSLAVDAMTYDAGLREIHETVTYPNTSSHLGSRP